MSNLNREIRFIVALTFLSVFTAFGILIFGLSQHLGSKSAIRLENLSQQENTSSKPEDDWDKVENGIHLRTGMIWDKNLKYIEANCLACHSSKLITQNRATRDGWKLMIRWMQETQGLHDLGQDETYVLDYLSTHYAPKETGRRPNLDIENIEWYVLNLD